MEKDFVLVKEAAAELDVSRWAIWRYIRDGRLKTERFGPLHAIPVEEWERFKKEEHKAAGRPRTKQPPAP